MSAIPLCLMKQWRSSQSDCSMQSWTTHSGVEGGAGVGGVTADKSVDNFQRSRGFTQAVLSLNKVTVREAPRRRSWRIDRLCRISARGTPKVGTSTRGYNRSGDPVAAEPLDDVACI